MVTKTKEMNTCKSCGHTGSDVLHYWAKVGGSDQPVEQSHCADIDACMKESEAYQVGRAEIEKKFPHFFKD